MLQHLSMSIGLRVWRHARTHQSVRVATEPLLLSMSSDAVFFGATVLTAITDNAALTYLGSLVPGLSEPFKHSLVAGAVTGGGLTIIANAPNPAGAAILKGGFSDQSIHAGGLLLAALGPTAVALLAFKLL